MQEIRRYLEDFVVGKALYTAGLEYTLDEGRLAGVYSDQLSFCNLKYSKTSLQFDMFIVANEKVYAVRPDGEKGALHKDFSGVSLFRFELALRQSTGETTGLFRFISASQPNGTAEGIVSGIHGVELREGTLYMQEEQCLYRDQNTAGGGMKPVAFSAGHRFYLESGLLHYDYQGKSFDVNPITLARASQPDSFPPFYAIERAKQYQQ